MGLLDDLKAYGRSDFLPLHMPGHKRKSALSGGLPYHWDITEIDGFDNLHAPEGLLADLCGRLAAIWGSAAAYPLINGSTCGILAGIRALAQPGDRILMARGCHQSVYHALELCDLEAVYIPSRRDPIFGLPLSVTPEEVDALLTAHPEIGLTVLTSPTYEGVCSDVAAIAEAVHRHGGVLFVDSAHGAHLGFTDAFPPSAVEMGADLTVVSMHKTLPCLTQTAAAHLSRRISPEIRAEFARNLAIFETSSPSYILLASIDHCLTLLEREKSTLFSDYAAHLADFARRTENLTRLRIPGITDPIPEGIFALDPGKITVSTRFADISGIKLADCLRRTYRIESEMAAPDFLLAMTSIADSAADLARFADALTALDADLSSAVPPPIRAISLPKPVLRVFEALRSTAYPVPLEQAIGQVCADTVRAYPPGIPLIVPGEVLDRQTADEIADLAAAGANILTKNGKFSGHIFIKAENTD